jgi:hypothetical protein
MSSRRSIVLRTALLAALGAATLAGSGSAFAQSQQGGYLGANPGAHQTASAAAPARTTTGQGGYLGMNAGADLSPARTAGMDMKASPGAWCRMASLVPGRCESRAADDHAYCADHDPDHYATCRRLMDAIGWHN